MNTAVTITAIIAAVVIVNIIATAFRPTAKAKDQHCAGCTCHKGTP